MPVRLSTDEEEKIKLAARLRDLADLVEEHSFYLYEWDDRTKTTGALTPFRKTQPDSTEIRVVIYWEAE